MEPSMKTKQDFEYNQVKEGSPLLRMRFGEVLSIFDAPWLLALSVLKAMELRQQLHSPAGPSSVFFLLFAHQVGETDFQAFWDFWSLGQGPRPKSESTASDLPSVAFFPMASLTSQHRLCFLALLLGQKPSTWSPWSLCSTQLRPGLWLQKEVEAQAKSMVRKGRGKKGHLNLMSPLPGHFFKPGFDIYYSLLLILKLTTDLMTTFWGRVWVGEILLSCRQFYCTHQK